MQDIIDSVGELGTILNGTNKNNGSNSDGVSFSGNYSTDGTWIGIIKEVKKAIATNLLNGSLLYAAISYGLFALAQSFASRFHPTSKI